jgi:asparagine synthase (glutamine-hydrolysing)
MPGIVGLITTKLSRESSMRELQAMTGAIRHESFYQTNTWIDESLGIYAGSVERKGSFAERMPLLNERKDVALFFSGEEFPEPGTPQTLREHGHDFPLSGPSYLVHKFEEDPHFLANLNGRFHGLVVDQRCKRTTLFNDRYGMHRIYFHQSSDAFYFAAEAKAILAVRPELRKADVRSLGELVACGCVLGGRTLFEGIHVLGPGSAWTFKDGLLANEENYFRPEEWESQPELDQDAYYAKLRETFREILPRYFKASEAIGLSLTGGLDTRMITAWHKAEPGSLPCYSFGGTYRDCRDVTVARKVASAYGQPYEMIQVGDEFLRRFAYYAERSVYLTDGCTAVNRAADLYANERAREIAPVRMTGNYGGEVLRRVVAFKATSPFPHLFSPEFLSHVDAAKKTYNDVLTGHPLSFAVFRQAPWHHYGLLALEQTQVTLRSPYLDNEFVRTVFCAPQVSLRSNDVSLKLIADGDRNLRSIPTDRGYGGNSGPVMSAIIQALIELTVKAEYAYDYGMPQWVAKVDHLFSVFRLERLFLGRHKFAHFRIWYRGALAEYVKQMLLDPRTLARPYLNSRSVEAMVHQHLKGVRNYTLEIHELLTLELLHRLFLDAR